MAEEQIAYIGNREIWGEKRPFGLDVPDRRHHAYVVGKTGTGKSTLLRNLIIQDIHSGQGIGVIDPHGDLADDLLNSIPAWRTDDVVYFSPADHAYPIGLNLLGHSSRDTRHLVASGIVSSLKSIWRESWGPRLEYILYAAVAALDECQNVTLLGVQRMLVDPRYRDWVVNQIDDPMLRAFWRYEFEGYDKRFLAEVIAPVQNKVGQLFMAAPIRNVLGQVKRKIDFRFMMDDRRIFIANLSKGKLGEDKSNLLGALLVTQFQQAAMSRADTREQERVDFHLFVDEFQNFATDAFAGILSEARKYRLCLTLSHQYLDQVPDAIRAAVFGNVGTLISFRVGEGDGAAIAREYGNGCSPQQFTDLANHEILVKLLSHGGPAEPFFAKTLAPLHTNYGRRETIIRRSRQKYATARHVVEEKIERWMHGSRFDQTRRGRRGRRQGRKKTEIN